MENPIRLGNLGVPLFRRPTHRSALNGFKRYTWQNKLLYFERPHGDKNTIIPVCHSSDIYSDILSGIFFWQILLAGKRTREQLWWNLETKVSRFHQSCHLLLFLLLLVEVRPCPLRSGAPVLSSISSDNFSGISFWSYLGLHCSGLRSGPRAATPAKPPTFSVLLWRSRGRRPLGGSVPPRIQKHPSNFGIEWKITCVQQGKKVLQLKVSLWNLIPSDGSIFLQIVWQGAIVFLLYASFFLH